VEIFEKLIERHLDKTKKKIQIVLTHTSRDAKEFSVLLTNRLNGTYTKIPHYLITRDGKVVQFLEDIECPNYFTNKLINTKSIIVCLENFGWLEKQPLKNYYINWIGNIYKEKVVERKWRDYFIWQPYTEIQMDKTVELCKELSKNHDINLSCVGHNTKVKGVESFLGILTHSNFNELTTDLSPAFDFETFIKKLKYE
jgi:N-acetyl-anhydromuramyl-L-alanine amidase AmpD